MSRPSDAAVLGAGALAVASMALAAEALLTLGATCLEAAVAAGELPGTKARGPATILALDDGDAA